MDEASVQDVLEYQKLSPDLRKLIARVWISTLEDRTGENTNDEGQVVTPDWLLGDA